MAKELVQSPNENWNVLTCVKEMRAQAEKVTKGAFHLCVMMKAN